MKIERLMEGWRSFINEQAEAHIEPPETLKSYDYCSIILTQKSQNELAAAIEKPPGFKGKEEEKDKKLSHHITINMGKSIKVPKYTNGMQVDVIVTEYRQFIDAEGKGIAAVVVQLPEGLKVVSGFPHITVLLKGIEKNNKYEIISPGKAIELKDGGKFSNVETKPMNLKLTGIVNIPAEVQ